MRFMESPYYQQEVQDLEVLQRRVQEYSHIMQIMGEGDIELRKEFLHALFACLLYTSPSPRDRTRSRMPSSA